MFGGVRKGKKKKKQRALFGVVICGVLINSRALNRDHFYVTKERKLQSGFCSYERQLIKKKKNP